MFLKSMNACMVISLKAMQSTLRGTDRFLKNCLIPNKLGLREVKQQTANGYTSKFSDSSFDSLSLRQAFLLTFVDCQQEAVLGEGQSTCLHFVFIPLPMNDKLLYRYNGM